MKRALSQLTILSLCFAVSTAFAADTGNQLKDKTDKISYSIGVDVGKSIQKQKIEIKPEAFLLGLKDGLADKSSLMTDDEIKQTLTALQTEMIEKQKTQLKEISAKNLTDGEKFLDDNKKKKGIVTTASGLQYRIIKDGQGDSPKASDTVTTHYVGKLIDGTEFDSSYKRGEPVKFQVNGVIPGWTEALQLMKPGAKWELFIPAKLAYGEQGVGQIIGPNSTLIFDVELLSVDKNAKESTESTEKKPEKHGKAEDKKAKKG